MISFYLIERTPGSAFTTFTNAQGEQVRVPIVDYRIGPFPSVSAVADYLAQNALPHTSYEIQPHTELPST